MPVKPATTFTFATGLNYTAGPFIGSATKQIPGDLVNGFIPGTGINSEWANYMLHWSGEWITDWVEQGSSAADLDAHIVETDAAGHTNIASATIGLTAAATTPLAVYQNSGAPTYAALIRNTSGNTALIAQTWTGASNAVEVACTGSGNCIDTVASGNGHGIATTANGPGRGGSFQSTGTGHAVLADADGTGSGVVASRKPTGGPAGSFGQNGAGAPVRGIIQLEPTLVPTVPLEGDVYLAQGNAGFNRGGVLYYDDDGAVGGGGPGFQKVWTTEGGYGYVYQAVEGDSTEAAGTTTTKVTVNLDSSGSPGNGQGKYIVHYTINVRLAGGAALSTRAFVGFYDDTGQIDLQSVDFAATGQNKIVSTFIEVTLGVPIVPLSIKFETSAPGNGVIASRARITAQGAHE